LFKDKSNSQRIMSSTYVVVQVSGYAKKKEWVDSLEWTRCMVVVYICAG
jgi:hypothetical protein